MKRQMKKAQISDQIVIYILGILIIGLLLFFGTKIILQTEQRIEEIDITSFKQSLESKINDLAPHYGSWKIVEIDAPKQVEKIYFLDLNFPDEQENINNDLIDNDLIKDIWIGKSSNVIVIPFTQQSSILINKIIIEDPKGYIVFDVVDGKITLKMIGQGDGVLIENIE